jgi:hypothetical protein
VIADLDEKIGSTFEVYPLLFYNVLTVPGQIDQVCHHFYAHVQRPTVSGPNFRRICSSHFRPSLNG